MKAEIRRLSYAVGAEIIGMPIEQASQDAAFQEVHRALLDYHVLLFRGRAFTREQYTAFGRRFGELETFRLARRPGPEYPEIITIVNEPKPDGGPPDEHYAGSDWHSDASFRVNPTAISMLHAVEIPRIGGDTQFANMYLAYETLSDGMKKILDGLEGVHIQEEIMLDHSTPERLLESRRAMTVAHPLVKVHPETGRKSLYLGDKVRIIAGMSPEESKPLIDFLCTHTMRPQFVYRHQWQKDDLLIWDNRCANHDALGDYDRQHERRHMEKIAVIGAKTGRLFDDRTQQRNLAPSFAPA